MADKCGKKCRLGILIFLAVLAAAALVILILAAVGIFNKEETKEVAEPQVASPGREEG